MALIGPDGEQHSQLDKRDVADPAPGSGPFGLPAGQIGKDWRDLPKVNLRTEMLPPPRRPDKGQWVGPPPGTGPEWPQEATVTPHEQAVTQAMQRYKQEVKESLAQAMQQYEQEAEKPLAGGISIDSRRRAVEALIALIDGELPPDQRRILIQALAVVAMLP